MNIAVGQGDILVTPLQLATAYAAMVNGGTVYQPRVVEAIVSPSGEVVRALEPPDRCGMPTCPPPWSAHSAPDMEAVVSAGTARAAFEDSGLIGRVGGKTGTAQGFEDNDGRLHDSHRLVCRRRPRSRTLSTL